MLQEFDKSAGRGRPRSLVDSLPRPAMPRRRQQKEGAAPEAPSRPAAELDLFTEVGHLRKQRLAIPPRTVRPHTALLQSDGSE